jgi:hypothetical protein
MWAPRYLRLANNEPMQSRYTLHHAYNSSAMNMLQVRTKRIPRKEERWAASRASALASGSAMTPAGDCCICSLQIMLRFEGDILKASGIAEIGGAK